MMEESILYEDIATRCPQDWGEAVYKARALWLQNGGGVDVRWEKCSPTEEQNEGEKGRFVQGDLKKEELELPIDKVLAYPVPVERQFVLSVPDNYVGGTYTIINSIGVPIANGSIGSSKTDINASEYSNGIHFVRVNQANLRPITISIVVQKL